MPAGTPADVHKKTVKNLIIMSVKYTPVGYNNIKEGGVCMDCENCGKSTGCGDCCLKTKERSAEEYKKLVNRLNRIEGQIRGIKGMVENSAYCVDIMVQVAAVNAALNAFNKELLSNHIRTCVAEGIKNGDEQVVDELLETLKKLMR